MSVRIKRIQLRRDTLENWTTANPILTLAEPAFVTDLQLLKIGNGTSKFLDLPYHTVSDVIVSKIQPLLDNLNSIEQIQSNLDNINSLIENINELLSLQVLVPNVDSIVNVNDNINSIQNIENNLVTIDNVASKLMLIEDVANNITTIETFIEYLVGIHTNTANNEMQNLFDNLALIQKTI